MYTVFSRTHLAIRGPGQEEEELVRTSSSSSIVEGVREKKGVSSPKEPRPVSEPEPEQNEEGRKFWGKGEMGG